MCQLATKMARCLILKSLLFVLCSNFAFCLKGDNNQDQANGENASTRPPIFSSNETTTTTTTSTEASNHSSTTIAAAMAIMHCPTLIGMYILNKHYQMKGPEFEKQSLKLMRLVMVLNVYICTSAFYILGVTFVYFDENSSDAIIISSVLKCWIICTKFCLLILLNLHYALVEFECYRAVKKSYWQTLGAYIFAFGLTGPAICGYWTLYAYFVRTAMPFLASTILLVTICDYIMQRRNKSSANDSAPERKHKLRTQALSLAATVLFAVGIIVSSFGKEYKSFYIECIIVEPLVFTLNQYWIYRNCQTAHKCEFRQEQT